MNDKPKINQKIEIIQPRPAPSLADACPLQHVTALIGLSRQRLNPDNVLRLIDKRHIRWAWDIARKGARRPEIRIWRQSFLACLAREKGEGEAAEELEPETNHRSHPAPAGLSGPAGGRRRLARIAAAFPLLPDALARADRRRGTVPRRQAAQGRNHAGPLPKRR